MKNTCKSKLLLKIAFFFLGLVIYGSNCNAKTIPGFIITESSDTITGEIKLSLFNPNTGGYIVHGIDLESFSSLVRFKASSDKRFRNYEPEDIKGFCFYYKSNVYTFRKLKLEFSSIIKADRIRYRFLNLIYKGELSLYRDIVRKPGMKDPYDLTNQEEIHYDYYLFNELNGLNKVELTKELKTIKDLLSLYNLDEDFLNQIPEKSKFKEIEAILKKYDDWLLKCNSVNI